MNNGKRCQHIHLFPITVFSLVTLRALMLNPSHHSLFAFFSPKPTSRYHFPRCSLCATTATTPFLVLPADQARVEKLSSILLHIDVHSRKSSYEVDVRIWVRLAFVQSYMHHGVV